MIIWLTLSTYQQLGDSTHVKGTEIAKGVRTFNSENGQLGWEKYSKNFLR